MATPNTYVKIGANTVPASNVTLPNERTFRDAWQLNRDVVEVDMAKAKAIHKDRIRQERISRFDPFDQVAIPLTRKAARVPLSTEEANKLEAAEVEAQKLRDAPADPRIDAATTPDELKALTLDVLTA